MKILSPIFYCIFACYFASATALSIAPVNLPHYEGGKKSLGNTSCVQTDDKQILHGAIMVKKGNQLLYGIADHKGNTLIAPQYEDIKCLRDGSGYYAVKSQGKWGVIDMAQQMILAFNQEDVIDKRGDLFIVERQGKTGVIDKSDKTQFPFLYDYLLFGDTQHMIVANYGSENLRYGIANMSGELTTPLQYEDIILLSDDGLYAAQQDREKWIVINTQGKQIGSRNFYKIKPYFNQLAAVYNAHNRIGFIDKHGQIRIPMLLQAHIWEDELVMQLKVYFEDERCYVAYFQDSEDKIPCDLRLDMLPTAPE